MKRSPVTIFTLLLLISSAAATHVSVRAQNVALSDPQICSRDVAREIRRVPSAKLHRDAAEAPVYEIYGNESWRRTDIEVKRGQKIHVAADGIVSWARGGIEKTDVSPDGTRPPYRDGWNYYHFPYPEAGMGSLVMRIGKGVYTAGSSVTVTAEDDGFIEFMVNDDKLDDNSGVFYVRIEVDPL